jgi:hypothetical protein
MIGLLILVGEVVRASVVSPGSAQPKARYTTGRSRRKVNGPWSIVRDPRPASGDPQ